MWAQGYFPGAYWPNQYWPSVANQQQEEPGGGLKKPHTDLSHLISWVNDRRTTLEKIASNEVIDKIQKHGIIDRDQLISLDEEEVIIILLMSIH